MTKFRLHYSRNLGEAKATRDYTCGSPDDAATMLRVDFPGAVIHKIKRVRD